jgi:hypothetical protein
MLCSFFISTFISTFLFFSSLSLNFISKFLKSTGVIFIKGTLPIILGSSIFILLVLELELIELEELELELELELLLLELLLELE